MLNLFFHQVYPSPMYLLTFALVIRERTGWLVPCVLSLYFASHVFLFFPNRKDCCYKYQSVIQPHILPASVIVLQLVLLYQ